MILITGTSRGVGLATAEFFLKNSCVVYGIDKQGSAIRDINYYHYEADVRLFHTLPDLEPEILIVNAGSCTNSEWDIDTNLKGSINTVNKYALKNNNLKSVLFNISVSAVNGAEFPYYVASKGGLLPYMKWLAQQLSSKGVTVNAISPGGINNEFNKHILQNEEKYNACLNETLLHKWASNEEIAEWIYFVTVVNKSMTGQNLIIDNGETSKTNFIW